jgi:uncharacterized protein (TIGR03083 family)
MLEQMTRGCGHLLDGGIECIAIDRRGLTVPAHLAHELQSGGTHLVVRNRFHAAECLDTAAHGTTLARDANGGDGEVVESNRVSTSRRPKAGGPNTQPRPLSIDQHLERLEIEGGRFGEVVGRIALDAAVPSCPAWNVEALIRHLGDVHRWAATIVRDRVQDRLRRDFTGPEDRDALLAWYTEGHAQLLDTLRGASPGDHVWAWAPAPNPLAFWARRQSHETAIHRLDAEQAAGSPTPFPADAATDGIDEWLTMASMRCRVADGRGRRLHLRADDLPAEWVVELRDDALSVQHGGEGGDCSVRGSASDLFALVMNRRDADGLDVVGDSDVLRAWRDSVRF